MNEKIKKYFPNITQACWMGTFVIIIPALIGVKQYGYFAKLYALPSILAGFIDSYYLSSSDKVFNYKKRIKDIFIGLISYINIFIIIILFLILFGVNINFQTNLLASFSIFISLFLRWKVTFLFHRIRNKTILKDSTVFEIINLGFYLFSFLFFFYLNSKNLIIKEYLFLIPCIIISLSGSITYFYSNFKLRNINEKDFKTLRANEIDKNNSNYLLKTIFFRSYEDSYISIMPLFLYEIFGAQIAGESRIAISILKAICKIFPHRYDLFIHRELLNKNFLKEFFIDSYKFLIRFILIFTLIFFLLKSKHFDFINSQYQDYLFSNWGLFILTAPFFSILASITPYLSKLKIITNIFWLIPITLTYFFTYLFSSLNLFTICFFVSNILLLILINSKIIKSKFILKKDYP